MQYSFSKWKRLLRENLCVTGELADILCVFLDSNLRGNYTTDKISVLSMSSKVTIFSKSIDLSMCADLRQLGTHNTLSHVIALR
jgi:hypothetical protein